MPAHEGKLGASGELSAKLIKGPIFHHVFVSGFYDDTLSGMNGYAGVRRTLDEAKALAMRLDKERAEIATVDPETGELVFVVEGWWEREGEWEWRVLTDHDRANASTKLSLYLLERDG